MSKPADGRVSPVFKAMNRPLTVLGAERRLFFVALISTKHDIEILRVLFNSGKFRGRYDPMKADTIEIRIARRNGQD